MANLFRDTTQASFYAKFRPNPPKELINTIISYLSERISAKDWSKAVDVGCGSGQCSGPLATHFTNVYAFDSSSAQINEAIRLNQFNNISFNVSSAEKMPIDSNSIQLITACQSVHWFDLQKFFTEVNRLLTPNGVLALLGYKMPTVSHPNFQNNERVTNLCRNFYKSPLLNWPKKERQLVDESYASISLPFKESIRNDICFAQSNVSAQELRGYLLSWSAYNALQQQNKEKAQMFLNSFDDEIKSIFGDKDFSGIDLKVEFNYHLLMGRKADN